ncbi:cytochrome P450 monooxygenase [Astrocystis sublimbata]|nr:cytochrome P450 monooxygenase [Astrocystis sublimbata]
MNETLASSYASPLLGDGVQLIPYVLGIVLVLSTAYAWATSNPTLKKLPLVNPPNLFSDAEAKRNFRDNANTILQKARKELPKKPYRMTTDYGEIVMLPSEWLNEVRNNPNLSFMGTITQERMCEIRGFEPLAAIGHDGRLVQIIARKQLTKLIAQVTAPLSEEIAYAVEINLENSTEWRETNINSVILDVTARMSSRVFLGEELARSEEWLYIAKNYQVDVGKAMNKLQQYPVNLRPYIGRFFPESKLVYSHYERSKKVIEPILEKRREMARAALQAGQKAPVFNDALGWIEEESKALNITAYDAATFNLLISTVAIGTTSDLLQTVLVDLARHPETLQAVRDEIVQILKHEGWKKTSLYNMKLMDSTIKESQRTKPFLTTLRRSVEADIVLSDGTLIKKGSRIHVDLLRMQDSEVYENPEVWKGDRFLEMRTQPGKDNLAQLVTTSSDHFGFGHGLHACPGRFLAANEIKIALCHLLMKYDWKMAPGTETAHMCVGFGQRVNAGTKLLYRKRPTVELDIDSIDDSAFL